MNVLLFGASGFIGRHVLDLLKNDKSLVHITCVSSKQLDFAKRLNSEQIEALTPIFTDVDVVINMVGVMHDDKNVLENVHHHTPVMLATFAKSVGVKRWIQLSALGADGASPIAFTASKGRGDERLLALADGGFGVAVVRPDLVYGQGGSSTALFKKLVRFGVVALPKRGQQKVTPVSVLDVARGIVALVGSDVGGVMNFVGSKTCSFGEYLTAIYQQQKQSQHLMVINLPNILIPMTAMMVKWVFGDLVSRQTLHLLNTHQVADGSLFFGLLGQMPRPYDEFVKDE